MSDEWIDQDFGPVTVAFGARGGKYPHGNSLFVAGRDETIVIDPSLGLLPRRDRLPHVDRILNSHCHEDHVAGNHLFPQASCHVHEADRIGLESIEGMMGIYGYDGPIDEAFRKAVEDDFHYVPRPDAISFVDGDRFDLGGVTIEVQHSPGHTRGHCCFRIRWDAGEMLYLGDIDLTSFGPYYGDAWSDLESFERTIEAVREIDVPYYATFHHIGVLEGREAFLGRLDRFAAKIEERESRLLEYLAEPRSLADVVEHRFIYRPQDPVSFADAVEKRSMQQHIDRLMGRGVVESGGDGRYVRV